MPASENVDLAALLIRAVLGVVMFAHGYNHFFGGGKLPGTARWFESIGIRPGKLHAVIASVSELVAGVALVVGLANPLSAAAVVGVMTVAFVANHRRNGFFIFRPGEGYEYVVVLLTTGLALGALGPGRLSVDHLLGVTVQGWAGLALAAGVGGGGAVLLLVSSWRPARTPA